VSVNIKRRVALGVIALAVTAFAGGAYAASQDSGANARQAFLDDVAKRLHVTPQQLTAAIKGASLDQLSAAVAAGKLTQAQANAIRQEIQKNGGAPLGPFLFGPGGRGGGPPQAPGFFHARHFFGGQGGGAHGGAAGPISDAAKYLGLSASKLFAELASGKSLAQIAKSRGKPVSGLKDTIMAARKARLDKAVAAKLLTAAQEQQILRELSARLDERINRSEFRTRFGATQAPRPAAPWA
jgi:AraC-like DNA-binding protein